MLHIIIHSPALRALLGLGLALTWARAQAPTDGFGIYNDSFYVQKPWDKPLEERYEFKDGVHTMWTYSDDKPLAQGNGSDGRTEMRWNTWTDQKTEHLWTGDVMIDSGSNQTCIFQVKSNTTGEAIYLQVFSPGEVHWGSQGGTTLISGCYGKWFNLKCAYNPSTGLARVWINDVLKGTQNHKGSAWYFKNGTYGTTKYSRDHYKNIQTWIKGGGTSAVLAPKATMGRAWPGLTAYSLDGRRVRPESVRREALPALISIPGRLGDPDLR